MADKYRSVKITRDSGGWGGPLIITPTEKRNKIISITGGGINPLAVRIAELSGAIAVDGFKNPVPNDEVACAVVDCGGTLRTGLFPKAGIPTVNTLSGGPSGPLADYCRENNYISGVTLENIKLADASEVVAPAAAPEVNSESKQEPIKDGKSQNKFMHVVTLVIEKLGRFIGKIVNLFYQGARDAVNMMIRNVLPFMIFISLMIAIINETGFGSFVANTLQPMTGTVWGLIIFAIIIGIPVLSPLLAPGAVIQSVLGVFIGTSIANGIVMPQLALPALFAISVVDACDFIPVAAALGEAEADTARLAVPSMLFSRFITAPIAVLIGWVFSIGLF
jgi:PTS system glucitol/sorbitol-specific IIC component